MSVYLIDGFEDKQTLLDKLGKHKIGKSCLYINRLSEIDEKVLTKLIKQSYTTMNKRYRK